MSPSTPSPHPSQRAASPRSAARTETSASKLLAGHDDLEIFSTELDRVGQALSRRINADPEKLEKGLAQLVLTLVELLRQLMERQALRRIEGGTLTPEETERLGRTFMLLEQRMEELKTQFGLEDEDLNLNLGPLGDLM
jgi:Gas vesicle protein K